MCSRSMELPSVPQQENFKRLYIFEEAASVTGFEKSMWTWCITSARVLPVPKGLDAPV
jgi:hypothetical protein